jgi:hypothetical protein
MKINVLAICLLVAIVSSCTRKIVSKEYSLDAIIAEEYKRDSLFYEVFKQINYEQYRTKTIGDLMQNDSINHFKIIHLAPSNGECLSYIEISCGYDVYFDIYLPEETKFIQKCLRFSQWKMEDVKKERIEKIVLERMFPQRKIVLFDRNKS